MLPLPGRSVIAWFFVFISLRIANVSARHGPDGAGAIPSWLKHVTKETNGWYMPTQSKDNVTTKEYSQAQLNVRAKLYEGVFGGCALFLVFLAIAVHVKKTGKFEVPVLRFHGCTLPPVSIETYDLMCCFEECRLSLSERWNPRSPSRTLSPNRGPEYIELPSSSSVVVIVEGVEAEEGEGEEELEDDDPDRLPEDAEPFPEHGPSGGEIHLTDTQIGNMDKVKQEAVEALEDGDHQKALDKYTEIVMMGNTTAMVYAKRAEVLLNLKRPNACIADCTAAISVNPNNGKAYRTRGKAQRALGHWKNAHKDLSNGQQLDFDDDTVEMQTLVAKKLTSEFASQEQAGAEGGARVAINATDAETESTKSTKEEADKAWEKFQHDNPSIEEAKKYRKCILCILLAIYVVVCTVPPYLNAPGTSCTGGFFWEDHVPFGLTFFVTKVAELAIYFFDPSIEGQLPLWQFMLLFIPSFLGYGDGYQDSTSTYIAHACAGDPDAAVNHELAGVLSATMSWSFWIGVVFLQWFCMGILGVACDPSLAVLAKLVHMDALAMCITVPPKQMWKLHAINAVRTFGEDMPQAGQQVFFVIYVKENVFMIISIMFSVCCSLKSLYDAYGRRSEAIGLMARKLAYYAQDRAQALMRPQSRGGQGRLLAIEGGQV